MKIFFFTNYYSPYLDNLYKKNTGLANQSYQEQMAHIVSDYFGDWAFYLKWFKLLDTEPYLIIPNCKPLQKAWARENDVKFNENDWQYKIPIAQARKHRPDIFYIGNMFDYYGSFLDEIRQYVRKIAGWIAVSVPRSANIGQLHLLISSHPGLVHQFREQGLLTEYLTAAFEPEINTVLKDEVQPSIDFSFIGSLSTQHHYRVKMIKELVERTQLEIYGPGISAIPDHRSFLKKIFSPSIYQRRYKGETWGLEMYKTLKRSKVTFNAHIDMSLEYMGNMRMFEATGVGTLLLTDGKNAKNRLFEEDEVVFYENADDAVAKLNYYLNNESERKKISSKGQRRTLSDYNYKVTSARLHSHFTDLLKR